MLLFLCVKVSVVLGVKMLPYASSALLMGLGMGVKHTFFASLGDSRDKYFNLAAQKRPEKNWGCEVIYQIRRTRTSTSWVFSLKRNVIRSTEPA